MHSKRERIRQETVVVKAVPKAPVARQWHKGANTFCCRFVFVLMTNNNKSTNHGNMEAGHTAVHARLWLRFISSCSSVTVVIGGVAVSILAIGPKVQGFKPGRHGVLKR
jgi:hypothetical protein